MATRRIFTVQETGVGRKDFSMNTELSVEPVIRSHLRRFTGTGIASGVPTLPYPNAWGVYLQFLDGSGNIVLTPPEDVTYIAYAVKTTGKRNTLTQTGLARYRAIALPGVPIIPEDVCALLSYGPAEQELLKGHIFEPGYVYWIYVGQWSEKPTYDISWHIQGMTDVIVG